MSQLTQQEQLMMNRIQDQKLLVSLEMIRNAVEEIWRPEIRLIRGYTDHGITHCQRLVDYASKLLRGNLGQALSEIETYLLLAGIYLHDIGMQCDVMKFPDIRVRSEEMGANFECEFAAKTANDLSPDEMKEIRKNHHYLSVAWIDIAWRTGKTVLGPAAKFIPNALILDLIDVCKYHTQLRIQDCPKSFTDNASERKQLVAAILRFADELDIESARVSLETVLSFSFSPENAVYWWLHHCTKVNFIQSNVIALIIRLAPADYSEFGSFVHAAFIREFLRKNREVSDVLVANHIAVVLSADSEVIQDEYAPQLPQEIVNVLKAMQSKGDHDGPHKRPDISQNRGSELYSNSVRRVLVIEDDNIWQRILTKPLSEAGFTVAVAKKYDKGAETLYYTALDAAVCIVDLGLGEGAEGLNGLGILGFCDLFGIPTIVVSGRLDEASWKELYREYGVAAYLDKSRFDEDEFVRLVHGITGSSQMRLHLVRERLMDNLVNYFQQTLKVILQGGTSQVIGILALRQVEKIANEFDEMREVLRAVVPPNDIFKLRADIRKMGDRWITESLSSIELSTQSDLFGAAKQTTESKQSFLDRHLRTQQHELERQYTALTGRINALEKDLQRSLDSVAKLQIGERKAEFTVEREQVAGRISEIERKLTEH